MYTEKIYSINYIKDTLLSTTFIIKLEYLKFKDLVLQINVYSNNMCIYFIPVFLMYELLNYMDSNLMASFLKTGNSKSIKNNRS